MGRVSLKIWLIGLMVCLGRGAGGPPQCAAQSIASSIKQGVSKFTRAVTPKTQRRPANDAVSLSGKGKPGAELYTAVGRLYEESGKLTRAAQQYEKALKHTPNYLGALLAYAQLKDRTGDPDGATKLYLRAAKANPNEASVFNNMGTFYARRREFSQAVAALQRAVRLQPKTKKYRNNIAVVLVEMGRTDEALGHLQAVHSEAVAHYNLGYLLQKKGLSQDAARHFSAALRKNPSLAQARLMLQRIQARSMQAQRLAARSPTSPRVSRWPSRPTTGQGGPPATSPRQRAALPQRPTTSSRRPVSPQRRAVPTPVPRALPYSASHDGWRPAVQQLPPPPKTRPSGSGQRRATESPSTAAAPMPPASLVPRRLPPVSGRPVTGPALAPPQPPLAP